MLTADPSLADFALLDGFYERHEPDAVLRLTREAGTFGLRTVVFAEDDPQPRIRSAQVILFHPGPQPTRREQATVMALPVFVSGPADVPAAPAPRAQPRVTFCGQATSRPGRGALALARRLSARLDRERVPPPVGGHLRLRRRAMAVLAAAPGIETSFIVRDRYRGGARDEATRAATTAEFERNLVDGDYVLCVRGGSNYSTRLFEALAHGRIPVIVDTDTVLPFETEVPWRELSVRVPANDLRRLPAALLAFHREHDVLDVQRRCRELWATRFRPPGYLEHLASTLAPLLAPAP